MSHLISSCTDVCSCGEDHVSNFSVCAFSLLPFTDKLTKEEEEIYKLQHDLERTAISQQQSKKISEVSSLRLTQQEYMVEVALQVPYVSAWNL